MFGKWSKKDKKLARIRGLQIATGVLVGLFLASLVIAAQMHSDKSRSNQLRDQAENVNPQSDLPPQTKAIGGPFNLTDQDGKAVTDASYAGKYLLVYFGYTYCPDLCPTGLQAMAHVMDKLGDAGGSKVQPLFVTIDPARDTAAKLKEYTASFHPSIIGLTGTPEQIAAVAKKYQVYYAKGEQVDEEDYMMDHSSQIYLMAPNSRFIKAFPENADPAAVVQALTDDQAAHK